MSNVVNGWEPRHQKAERIVAHIVASKVTAAQVKELLAMEDAGFDTTDFWQSCAAKAGVNFPSRKARELVAEIIESMEHTNA